MKLAQFVPSAVRAWAQKSFSAAVRAFVTGSDVEEQPRARLSQPYAQSAWIRSAVNHVAGELSGRALKFYDGDNEYADARFVDWWEYPALGPATLAGQQPRLSRSEVLFDLAAWAKLEGEFFLLFDDSWAIATLRRNPAALTPFIIARPDRMRLIIRGGLLEGYEYIEPGGTRRVLVPEQVIHWKGFNPYDDWRGVGDLQAAKVPAEGAFYTGVYIRELMRNNGDTGFIVVGKSGPATPEQQEQIEAGLRAKRLALRQGIAKDIFLAGGDMQVERPKQEAASADLVGNKSLSHQEVYVAFGVPPSMGEVKAAYSVGKDSDYYQLVIRTCQPLGQKIASALGRAASRMAGRTLTAELDWDDHPVMIEVRFSRIEAAARLWGMGQPMKAINDYLDLGMEPFPGWDVSYLPFSVVPADGMGSNPTFDPTLEEPEIVAPAEDDPMVAELRTLLLVRQRAALPRAEKVITPAAPDACACCAPLGDLSEIDKDRDPAEIAAWREQMRGRREQMRGFQSRFRRSLMTARREVLAKIDEKGAQPKSTHSTGSGREVDTSRKAVAADFLFSVVEFAATLRDGMAKQHQLAVDAAGKQVMAELGRDDPAKFAPADVLNFISGRENKLSGIAEDVFGRIKDTLQTGLDAGDSTAQLAARVRAEFNGIDRARSMVIAQTETAAAFGYGRDAAMKEAGVTWKKWLTSGNSNVRRDHAAANGQIVRTDEAFEVGGEFLQYPGDPAGSPGNTINCHCVSIAVADGPDA